jgi:hypothetical protein
MAKLSIVDDGGAVALLTGEGSLRADAVVVQSEARIAVAKALALLPTLTPSGIGAPAGEFDLKEVATAIKFLRQCRPAIKPRFSSYGLKHVAERWSRRYVSNGALIAAAVYLDLKISPPIAGFPNVLVAVDGRDVSRLNADDWRRRQP